MLSPEENALLTQVGPGTAMGALLRQYWIPALRSERLRAGGAPVKVRLLGENFVAFRADDGRVGFFDEACPHRGASLALARNEDCALRCIFHGWKFDVSGRVVEIPSEPPELRERLAEKVRLRHYPVVEMGEVVWVWLGEGDEPSQFPDFEFASLSGEQVFPMAGTVHCNWLQPLEGSLDSSHLGILHSTWMARVDGQLANVGADTSPRYDFQDQPYGFQAAAIRTLPDALWNTRVTEFVMPWYSHIPFAPDEPHVVTAAVPVDDETATLWYFFSHGGRSIAGFLPALAASMSLDRIDPDDYVASLPRANSWGQDRAAMEAGQSFTGLPGAIQEDVVITESMGPVVDRSKEHLGSSDQAIIRLRRSLLRAARAHQQGAVPEGLDRKLDYRNIRGDAFTHPGSQDWREARKALPRSTSVT